MALKQVYNSRSKKWVLYDDAKRSGIINMQDEPYDGVPKKGEIKVPEKPEKIETPEMQFNENEDDEDEKPMEDKSGWFSVFGL